MPPACIRRLGLTNFRSYRSAGISAAPGLIALVGPNGAGKTNVLEAISFLAPGRGLRRATLEEVAFSEGDGSWAVAAEVDGALGLATLGTGMTTAAAYRLGVQEGASALAMMHTLEEHILIDSLVPRAKLLAGLLVSAE